MFFVENSINQHRKVKLLCIKKKKKYKIKLYFTKLKILIIKKSMKNIEFNVPQSMETLRGWEKNTI